MVGPAQLRRAGALLVVAVCLLGGCSGSPGSRGTASIDDLSASIEAWRHKRDTRANIRAIIVSTDGRTVLEKYYGTTPDVARDMESVTKSITATLVGLAVARGDLTSVDQRLADLLPAYASDMSRAVGTVSVRDLLTMTGGVPDWTDATSPSATNAPDWVASILSTMSPSPNSRFQYSNPDAHLVAAIVAQATGKSLLDFAREALFDPLGIDSAEAIAPPAVPSSIPQYKAARFAWPVDPQHINLGFSLLTLRPRDMLKIGELYLNNGRSNGTQLLPSDWVAQATSPQVKTYDTWDSYGYLWWITAADRVPAFAAIGAGGQLIEVIPSRKVVVVVSSDYDAFDPAITAEETYDLTSMVNDLVAPAFRP